VLAVDLDGVVVNYTEALRPVAARNVQRDLDGIEPTDWGCSNWGIRDQEHFLEIHRDAVEWSRIYRRAPMIEGASANLWALSDAGVHIRIVTHRLIYGGNHRQVVCDTAEWLDRYKIPYRDLLFLGDKDKIDADLFVDDAPHNIMAIRKSGKQTITFDQPYNQDVRASRRAHSWPEVYEIVMAHRRSIFSTKTQEGYL
jgi:5'-nucleotidase